MVSWKDVRTKFVKAYRYCSAETCSVAGAEVGVEVEVENVEGAAIVCHEKSLKSVVYVAVILCIVERRGYTPSRLTDHKASLHDVSVLQ